jgi:hypothetical protein
VVDGQICGLVPVCRRRGALGLRPLLVAGGCFCGRDSTTLASTG